jgi:hypothetical protein
MALVIMMAFWVAFSSLPFRNTPSVNDRTPFFVAACQNPLCIHKARRSDQAQVSTLPFLFSVRVDVTNPESEVYPSWIID